MNIGKGMRRERKRKKNDTGGLEGEGKEGRRGGGVLMVLIMMITRGEGGLTLGFIIRGAGE